jgi:fructokinase
MRKIFGIGESVLDIIFKDDIPQAAKPGGSILNSLVSMGRINLPVSFISEYGLDMVGDLIDRFLNVNGVDTSSVNRFEEGNTSLALAFLDEKNDAHYTFYKDFPSRQFRINYPEIHKDDIVQCGSFYAIWPEIREEFKTFVRKGKDAGALILYDPNFRKPHIPELDRLRPFIEENIGLASIIRGSDEDFRNIFGARSADEAWDVIEDYCRCLVYTANADGVFIRSASFNGKFPVRKIIPLSTIGAGDNFNAGMITALFQKNVQADQLDELSGDDWRDIISVAVDFASEVCMSYENYIPHSFALKFMQNNQMV